MRNTHGILLLKRYTENGHKLRISGKENEDSDKIGE